jgi:hypothetical protein
LANTYDLGDLIRVSAAFASAGAAIDPTAVTVKYRAPVAGTTTLVYGVDADLVKDDTGEYHVDIDADEEGTWYYRFESTGTGQAAAEGAFRVRVSSFA